MAGFLTNVAAGTVAGFVVMGISAVALGAMAWWPDEQLRPWVLAGCYVVFVGLVVYLRLWRYAKKAMHRGGVQPLNEAGITIGMVGAGTLMLIVGFSARQIVIDAHTAHEIGWILSLNLAALLPFRIAFVTNEVFRKRPDNGVVKVTYSMSPRGRAIWGSIMRIASTVFYALLIWALIFICDVNTGSATWEAWSHWRP